VFAATLLGGVLVPVNTALRGGSLTYVLRDSEPAALVVHDDQLRDARQYARTASPNPQIVVVGDAPLGPGETRFGSLGASGAGLTPPSLRAEQLALILYTSGTTGMAKGNMVSHRASLWMAATAAATMGYAADDVVHTCLPLFHANALQCGLIGGLWSGAETVIAPRFTASGFWEQVRDAGATHTALLGSMMPLLTAQPAGSRDRDHRVHTAYCAPLPEDIAGFEERFGLQCASTYGLTDGNIMTVRPPDSSAVPSCGVASPDWEVALLDDEDMPVASGHLGELAGRPRLPYIASSGYWRNPQATTELWRNLWCHSGDLLRQDAEGRFLFIDRKKDALRKGGENVSSVEVEAVLLSHPDVASAAVFGIPSALSEDEVMAVIVRIPGSPLTPEEIFAVCARELPYFAVPRYIEFAQVLAQNESHRVRKSALRARGVTESTWDAGPVTRRRFERDIVT
jgi:crotonobetaine/carnitine-CoA ligase